MAGGVQSTHPSAKSFTLSSSCSNANSRTSRLHGGAHRVQNAMIHLRLSDPGTFPPLFPSFPFPSPPALPNPTPSDILCANAVASSKTSWVSSVISVFTSTVAPVGLASRCRLARSASSRALFTRASAFCVSSVTASPMLAPAFSRVYPGLELFACSALAAALALARATVSRTCCWNSGLLNLPPEPSLASFRSGSRGLLRFSRSFSPRSASVSVPSGPPMVNTKSGSRFLSARGSRPFFFVGFFFSFFSGSGSGSTFSPGVSRVVGVSTSASSSALGAVSVVDSQLAPSVSNPSSPNLSLHSLSAVSWS
mmetsp:Transcript_8936/g.40587  ORF Transcript_8936/g.40587 Transcript_8936/m.40587 type:complete len:310 (-) Transcript_8936:196-1125(-)